MAYQTPALVNKFINYFSNNENDASSNGQTTHNTNNNGSARQIKRSDARSRQSYNGNTQNHGNNYRGTSRQNNNAYYNNYNPYANNGRQNKCHNNHSHNHQQQAQLQSFVRNQRQQTAQTQTFLEQVNNTVLSISLAGKSYHDGQDEETVDLLCDSAVISLNMFAVSCEQLHADKDQDALDLGRKRAHDNFVELESKNKAVYDLIEPHRNFINAALNGQKNLRYKEDRVEPGAKELFERDTDEINKALAHMIHHQQQFDKSREALLEQKTNEKLAKQHQSELNEYRRNDKKYGRNNKRSKNKSGPKYDRAKVTDLYFTKSGKSAEFVDIEAVERAKREQQDMHQDLCGSVDVYEEILPKIRFLNVALKKTKKYKWDGISQAIPCQIVLPNKKERENQDKSMVEIRPCYPWDKRTWHVADDLLVLDENVIKRIEKKQISYLEMTEANAFNQNLGYKAIEEREREIDIDHYVDEDSDDDEMNGNGSNN